MEFCENHWPIMPLQYGPQANGIDGRCFAVHAERSEHKAASGVFKSVPGLSDAMQRLPQSLPFLFSNQEASSPSA